MAYVPGGDLAAIIVSRFRMSLSKPLLAAKATFPAASADPRLAPLLHGVHKQYVGATEFNNAAAKNKGGLTPENLDVAAKKNMPLCMARLHSTVSLLRSAAIYFFACLHSRLSENVKCKW
jgi:hypothetical protein